MCDTQTSGPKDRLCRVEAVSASNNPQVAPQRTQPITQPNDPDQPTHGEQGIEDFRVSQAVESILRLKTARSAGEKTTDRSVLWLAREASRDS